MVDEKIKLSPEKARDDSSGYPEQLGQARNMRQIKLQLNLVFLGAILVILVAVIFNIQQILSDEERKNFQSSPADFSDDYLGDDYQRILIEVDVVGNQTPDLEALEHLKLILERESEKEVEISVDDQLNSSRTVFSLKQINDLEGEHRDRYRGDGTAIIYIQYLNGSFDDSPEYRGVAYHGSSCALFMATVREDGVRDGKSLALEKRTLVHEAGHLLGLVEINYRSEHQHQDPEHEYHCNHENTTGASDCVMGLIKDSDSVDKDEIPLDFCEYCLADLEQQRG